MGLVAVVTGERLALNLMQRMSGIATATRAMVQRIAEAGARAVLLDTRKTSPRLRALDKAAVVVGGARNHRRGLFDQALIKDNHITAAGGITAAFDKVKRYIVEHELSLDIVVEARTLDEVDEVLSLNGGVHRILLDNMVRVDGDRHSVDTTMLHSALVRVAGRLPTEASGNVTLETIADVARTGVDYISCGALTHSVVAMDISLKISLGVDSGE